ncbi:MAG: hypothetical protein AAGA11_03975, partial [Pseudomonadota bacterium]
MLLFCATTLVGCLDGGLVSGSGAQSSVSNRVSEQRNSNSGGSGTQGQSATTTSTRAPNTGALIAPPTLVACTPNFQTIAYEHSIWPQSDFGLPTAVGASKVWSHPGGGNYDVKVTKVANASSAASMGATHYLHRIPEYSQHDAFSADGSYLVSHGIVSRALYSGITYQNLRVVQNSGAVLGDWQWHPTNDAFAFYFDRDNERVYRYNANDDTHTVLFDFLATPVNVDGQIFNNLGTTNSNDYAMGGQG